MKEIRVFTNPNKFSLVKEVNDFIKSTKYEIYDIQYGVSGGWFCEHSVMIVLEVNNEES